MDKKPLPERITGSRVELRKHVPEVALPMFECIEKDRARLNQFLPWVVFSKSIEDSQSYIQKTMQDWTECNQFDFGLFEIKTNQYVGDFGVHHLDWVNENCELGYWVAQQSEGKGYISEAITLMEKVLFDLGFFRIEIRCSVENQRSMAVAKRLNYQLDGTLRLNSIDHGKRRGTHVFSKLKSDLS